MKKINYLPVCLLLVTSPQTMASAIYLGYSQGEQQVDLGKHSLDFKPAGQELLLSLDLAQNWTLSADYSTHSDDIHLAQERYGRIDSDAWGINLNYYWQDWSFAIGYSSFKDEQLLRRTTNNPFRFEQDVKSPSYSISAAYLWEQNQWFYNATLGLSYSDWQQTTVSPQKDRPTPRQITERGDSTFFSALFNVSRNYQLEGETAMNVGLGIGWNQLLSDSSNILSINGRSLNQRRPPTNGNRLTPAVAVGGESYGQASLFLGYDFSANWFAEVSTSVNFATDEDNHLWAMTLGYVF